MKRILTAAAFAAALVAVSAGPAAASGPIVEPGGQCNGVVDVLCRSFVCGPDDLDCGMIPPCILWVSGSCLI